MSPAARAYARERLAVLRRIGGVAEPDRLWRNMLSSQPLAFSIAGELRADPEAAAAVLGELVGRPVAEFVTLGGQDDDHRLDGLDAEWFPPREWHTRDRSGFDVAAALGLDDGSRMLLTVEVKLVDSFSAARLETEGYAGHLAELGLEEADAVEIVGAGGSQFLRSVLLTESVRRRGLRGEGGFDHACAVVLGRADDGSAKKVVDLVARHCPRVQIAYWSHDELFAAAARRAELSDWARSMAGRYTLGDGQPAGPATDRDVEGHRAPLDDGL